MRDVYVNSPAGLWSATRPDDWSDPDEVTAEEYAALTEQAAVRRAEKKATAKAASVTEQQARFDKIAEKFDTETAELLLGKRPAETKPKDNNGKGRDS